MKKSLLKKITTAVIATTVSAVMCFPLSASAYQGTYVNSYSQRFATESGYSTQALLVLYTKEVEAKTVIYNGAPNLCSVNVWTNMKNSSGVYNRTYMGYDEGYGSAYFDTVKPNNPMKGAYCYHLAGFTSRTAKVGNY